MTHPLQMKLIAEQAIRGGVLVDSHPRDSEQQNRGQEREETQRRRIDLELAQGDERCR
jgi:hypothetical protein